eukprot:IDg14943t1
MVSRRADVSLHSPGGLRKRADRRTPFETVAIPSGEVLIGEILIRLYYMLQVLYHQRLRGSTIQSSPAWNFELVPAVAAKDADVGDVWLLSHHK